MQITVPNADLAKTQVTNKTCRDATLFRHVIALGPETTPAEITDFCRRIMDLLETYPVDGLSEPPPRVRLVGIGDGAVRVEVQAEFLAENEDDFYRLQNHCCSPFSVSSRHGACSCRIRCGASRSRNVPCHPAPSAGKMSRCLSSIRPSDGGRAYWARRQKGISSSRPPPDPLRPPPPPPPE